MAEDPTRTDATGRERSPDHQYTLSIDQAAELYAKAGHPRTARAIQKYCAVSKLDCHKVETDTGEKYLVAPYSVERHIAYINEIRTAANGRDQSRAVANVRPLDNNGERSSEQPRTTPNGREQSRTDDTVRATDDRYIQRLESENDFLKQQIGSKDKTIEALLERDRETNLLVAGLQKMLTPLLGRPGDSPAPTSEPQH